MDECKPLALGSFETTITATTKFSVIGAHFAFTYFGANVTFQYSLGDEDSDTYLKLFGAVEFALPCNPGMLGKGKGLFKARMGEFRWDMVAYVTVYCGNTGPEAPVVTVSAQTIGAVHLTDAIKFDKLKIDAAGYILDNGDYAFSGRLQGRGLHSSTFQLNLSRFFR